VDGEFGGTEGGSKFGGFARTSDHAVNLMYTYAFQALISSSTRQDAVIEYMRGGGTGCLAALLLVCDNDVRAVIQGEGTTRFNHEHPSLSLPSASAAHSKRSINQHRHAI